MLGGLGFNHYNCNLFPSYARWRSDDPEIFVEPVDLFHEQDRGLPENCGKKDRKTTLQAYFTCHPCQCDLMGIAPLRSVSENNIIMGFSVNIDFI